MRALRIAAGLAVLLNALHFVHAIQHFWAHDLPHSAASSAGLAAAILIDLLTFTGGFLLLWRRG
jgi:hypothetical protein